MVLGVEAAPLHFLAAQLGGGKTPAGLSSRKEPGGRDDRRRGDSLWAPMTKDLVGLPYLSTLAPCKA